MGRAIPPPRLLSNTEGKPSRHSTFHPYTIPRDFNIILATLLSILGMDWSCEHCSVDRCRWLGAVNSDVWKMTRTRSRCFHAAWQDQRAFRQSRAKLCRRVIWRHPATSYKFNIDAFQVILKSTCRHFSIFGIPLETRIKIIQHTAIISRRYQLNRHRNMLAAVFNRAVTCVWSVNWKTVSWPPVSFLARAKTIVWA